MPADFNWQELNDEDRVAPSIQAVAAYLNGNDDIVIRQERGPLEDEDSVIVLPPEFAERLAKRLLDLAKEAKEAKG